MRPVPGVSWGAQTGISVYPGGAWAQAPGQPVTSLGKAPRGSSSGIFLLLPEERWKGGIYREETTKIQPTAEAQRTGCAWLQDLAGVRGQGAVIGMAWWGWAGLCAACECGGVACSSHPSLPTHLCQAGKGTSERPGGTEMGPMGAGGGLAQERVVVGSERKGLGS